MLHTVLLVKKKHKRHTLVLVAVREESVDDDGPKKKKYYALFQNWWQGHPNWIEFELDLIISMHRDYPGSGFNFLSSKLQFDTSNLKKDGSSHDPKNVFATACHGLEDETSSNHETVTVFQDDCESEDPEEGSDESIQTSSVERENYELICEQQRIEFTFKLPASCMHHTSDPNAIYIN